MTSPASLGFPLTIRMQENHRLSLVNTRLDSYFLQNNLVMMTMTKENTSAKTWALRTGLDRITFYHGRGMGILEI